jgi:hypothetical protein
MAQGGGQYPERLPSVLATVLPWVKSKV